MNKKIIDLTIWGQPEALRNADETYFPLNFAVDGWFDLVELAKWLQRSFPLVNDWSLEYADSVNGADLWEFSGVLRGTADDTEVSITARLYDDKGIPVDEGVDDLRSMIRR